MTMRYALLALLLYLCNLPSPAQPICRITHYDEFNGLSQRLVKQAVQDHSDMMWFATWNGLNRFDGYDFITIKPHVGDGTGIYSDRINDIKLMATGNLWCRVDYRCVIFDVNTHRFIDFLTTIEQETKQHFEILKLMPAEDGTTVMECTGGVFLTVEDSNPTATAQVSHSLPTKRYRPPTNKQYENINGLPGREIIYSCTDKFGTIWVITRNGEIYHTDNPATPPTKYPEELPALGTLYYTMTDNQGNVWLRSSYGLYKLVFERYPYTVIPQQKRTQVRCLYKDQQERTWMAGRDDETVRLLDNDGNELGYLGQDGRIHKHYTTFGASVYCMTEDDRKQLWLGTKPHGLFRLTEQANGQFLVDNYRHDSRRASSLNSDNIYDLCIDDHGRLWIATMKGGINCLEDIGSDKPVFLNTHNGGICGYPREAMSVRKIHITSSGTMLLATTEGLVTAYAKCKDMKEMRFLLHTGEADRAGSLGNVALMDILEDSRHRVFVATESGGINQIMTDDLLAQQLEFRHFTTENGLSSDIVLSLTEYNDNLLAIHDNSIAIFNPDSVASSTYDLSYWKRKLRFSDAHPLYLGKGRWMFGLQDGCIVANMDSIGYGCHIPPIALTSISVQNRREDFAVNNKDTIVLKPDERNITIRFAALDYADATKISYAFCMDDNKEWNSIGKTRSVTFLDMEPGTYRLKIRSTDSNGRWVDNVRTLTIVVIPVFWETRWAQLLCLLTVLAAVLSIMRVVSYVRNIKRKQKETLDAYLKLLNERQEQTGNKPLPTEYVKKEKPTLNEEDELIMKRIMEFVEKHVCDSDINIEDMASAAAVSKSGLNRKMKSILGITPAEFLRETRLQRAATLLITTNKPISDIAIECGFTDQSYFGKCFKARHGASPSEFRKQTGT